MELCHAKYKNGLQFLMKSQQTKSYLLREQSDGLSFHDLFLLGFQHFEWTALTHLSKKK